MAEVSITKDPRLCNLQRGTRPALALLAAISGLGFGSGPAHLSSAHGDEWVASAELRAPPPAREFRGVWIATVYNIDWPSKSSLSPASQRDELIALLDLAERLNLNAVVLQVRSMADAFYDSPIEPWSTFLTGQSGRAPAPHWDPLTFAVEAAHARGLELHAWFNPFRASVSSAGTLAAKHITRTHPEVVRKAGSTRWLDPTAPLVRKRALDVIADVVSRYDVDGVHIDDYFFPYPASGGGSKFDDSTNWKSYQAKGGTMKRDDWRREQVNAFIREFYRRVKASKAWVKVGVSPFGIWRPGVPEGIKGGLDSFAHIYADSKKWLNEGWIDYLTPQLYWKTKGPQAFGPLFDWWRHQNVHGRHLWPGISTARIGRRGVGESDGRGSDEIALQIDITRGSPADPALPAAGHLHWSISSLKKNADGIADQLRKQTNRSKVLTPASPWLAAPGGSTKLPRPVVEIRPNDSSQLDIDWDLAFGTDRRSAASVRWWCVQTRSGSLWRVTRVLPPDSRAATVPATMAGAPVDAVAICAVGYTGATGPTAVAVPQAIELPFTAP